MSHCSSRGREFDPGPVPYFCEIDHEILFLWSFSTLPLNHSRRVYVSYKQKYVHKVLVNCLFKLAQEKSVARLTDRPEMTIAIDWYVKQQNTNKHKFLFLDTGRRFSTHHF